MACFLSVEVIYNMLLSAYWSYSTRNIDISICSEKEEETNLSSGGVCIGYDQTYEIYPDYMLYIISVQLGQIK